MSSNGNIFCVTGHLCGEFTGPREFPAQRPVTRRFMMFSLICVWINDWVNNREAGDVRRYRAHYDVIVMIHQGLLQYRHRNYISETPLLLKFSENLFVHCRRVSQMRAPLSVSIKFLYVTIFTACWYFINRRNVSVLAKLFAWNVSYSAKWQCPLAVNVLQVNGKNRAAFPQKLGCPDFKFWSKANPLSLQWRHNELDGVSNRQPHDCLFNRLFRRRSKKTSKLRVKCFHLMTSSCNGYESDSVTTKCWLKFHWTLFLGF